MSKNEGATFRAGCCAFTELADLTVLHNTFIAGMAKISFPIETQMAQPTIS